MAGRLGRPIRGSSITLWPGPILIMRATAGPGRLATELETDGP
jgi:hypothetical protein